MEKALKILNILSEHGKAYIVGGAVRDHILKQTPKDIDISTNVSMDKIESLFDTHEIGKNKDFGIVVINFEGETFEIAQFRTDGIYKDGRHPESVKFVDNVEEDLARRDFTINAMAMDKDGNIIDPFKGQWYLKRKQLKTVGNPKERFTEDFLRMLRAVRFLNRFNLNWDENTYLSILDNVSHITQISWERIQQELWKMTEQGGYNFHCCICEMLTLNLLKEILPEIDCQKYFHHPKKYHPEGGVFTHTMEALKSYKGNDPFTLFAILLHDIGKPYSYRWRDKHTYYGHEMEGSRIIKERIAPRFKWSNKLTNIVDYCCINHMRFHLLTKMKHSKVMEMVTHPYWKYLYEVGRADNYSRGKELGDRDWKVVNEFLDTLKNAKATPDRYNEIKKLINGKFVMEVAGIDSGPEVGVKIKKTIAWMIDNQIDTSEIEKIKTKIIFAR